MQSTGPGLHVVGVYPEPGAGLECFADAGDCGVARDSPFEIRFDRPLLPSTVVRQSLAVFPAGQDESHAIFFQPIYDPLERVVTYAAEGSITWAPGLLYEVSIRVPKEGKRDTGFRAYDGAPLVPDGSLPLDFSFKTRLADPTPGPPPDPPPACDLALEALSSGGCVDCHLGIARPPMGLALESGASLEATAIGHVAHETDTGGAAGRALVDVSRFGVGMPIIAPGDPGNSYLLYKVLANPANYGADACTTAHTVALPDGQCLPPSPGETRRMQDWFLRADPMPPPSIGESLSLTQLRTLQAFIQAGASLTGCP